MTDSEVISRIIYLETQIVEKIINDKNYRSCDNDQFKSNREELKILREKVKHIIYPKSAIKGGDPQRPDSIGLEIWKKENLK